MASECFTSEILKRANINISPTFYTFVRDFEIGFEIFGAGLGDGIEASNEKRAVRSA